MNKACELNDGFSFITHDQSKLNHLAEECDN